MNKVMRKNVRARLGDLVTVDACDLPYAKRIHALARRVDDSLELRRVFFETGCRRVSRLECTVESSHIFARVLFFLFLQEKRSILRIGD